MKLRKLLAFGALLLLTLVFATGCGVEDPTKKDVEKVLEKIGAIPEDDEDDDSKIEYSIEIDKVKLNDDKDKATVECTLSMKGELATVAQQYKMTFRLNDDKEWKIKNSKLEEDVELVSQKLATEIGDETFKELLSEWYSIEVGETYLKVEDIADSVKITKHELAEDSLKDTVTFEGTASVGIAEYQFTVKAECEYFDRLGEWSMSSCKTDDYKVDYSIDGISKEDFLAALEDSYESSYIDALRVDSDELSDVEIVSHEANLEELQDTVKIHASFTQNAMTYTFDAEVVCEYSTSREEWAVESFTIDESSVKTDYPDDYLLEFTAEDYNRILHASDATVTTLGNTYNMSDENVSVVSAKNGEFELTGGTHFSLPVEMTIKTADMEIDLEVEITLDYDSDGWEFYSWTGSVVGVQNAMTGTWTGSTASTGEITVVIERAFDEDGYYIAWITEAASGSQYRCALYKFDPSTGEVQTSGSEGSINVKGVINGTTWTLDKDSVVLQKK